mmetsp:Transcript_2442/g.5798  ORF Transcript_2442/g.5798 Transcript_2442/m.5798 type:complete len:505 (-) Transcript_2442:273-1787(-)
MAAAVGNCSSLASSSTTGGCSSSAKPLCWNWEPLLQAPQGPSQLRSVVVVHRHGARLPTKPPPPGDSTFPRYPGFWQEMKGNLTPLGASQMKTLGRCLRERYREAATEQGAASAEQLPVVAFTSAKQRSIHSAWNFLHGYRPDCSVKLQDWEPNSGRLSAADHRLHDTAAAAAATAAAIVPLLVEVGTDIFHGWETIQEHRAWLEKNKETSARLLEFSEEERVADLLAKIHRVTGDEKLNSSRPILKRLFHLRRLDTLALIGTVHGMKTFSSTTPESRNSRNDSLCSSVSSTTSISGSTATSSSASSSSSTTTTTVTPAAEGLSFAERALLADISREAKRCWFQDGSRSPQIERSFGMRAAASLAKLIGDLLQVTSAPAPAGGRLPNLAELSCHDRTLAALANLLGVDLESIGFASNFVFELHDCGRDGGLQLRTFYNGDPFFHSGWGAPRRPPLSEKGPVVLWENLPKGALPFDLFLSHCDRCASKMAHHPAEDSVQAARSRL